mmetsp:Transcript_10696/g.28372  ORF Transcript_10696/g.28372 Transcript_10696/m.28372 type:complete len:391 (-) Transcript_10696:1343-2515(-)
MGRTLMSCCSWNGGATLVAAALVAPLGFRLPAPPVLPPVGCGCWSVAAPGPKLWRFWTLARRCVETWWSSVCSASSGHVGVPPRGLGQPVFEPEARSRALPPARPGALPAGRPSAFSCKLFDGGLSGTLSGPGTSAAAAATAEAPAPLGGLRGCAALSAGAAFPEPAAVLLAERLAGEESATELLGSGGSSFRMRGRTERMFSPSLNSMSSLPLTRLAVTVTTSHPKFVCTLITSPTCTSNFRSLCGEALPLESFAGRITSCTTSSSTLLPSAVARIAAAVVGGGAGPTCTSFGPLKLPRGGRCPARGLALQPAVSLSTTSWSSSLVRTLSLTSPSLDSSTLFLFASPAPLRTGRSSGLPSSSGAPPSWTGLRDVPPMSISQMLMAASWM